MHDEFAVHMLNDAGKLKAASIATVFDDALRDLESLMGSTSGRRNALVKTKLEEACFFAKKEMASQPGNQV